ncbi:MAG: 2OG-Fe(II) oxygenase family protein [Nitrospira sp.]
MRARFRDFHPQSFSFHKDPVLILEDVWSQTELTEWRAAMNRQSWTSLSEMPAVARAFPNAGNWAKAPIAGPEGAKLLDRLSLPCLASYMESFPSIKGRQLSFSYYSYAAGDCLPTHDDTDDAYALTGTVKPTRRIAMVAYFHATWEPDWGGELIVYNQAQGTGNRSVLTASHCIMPTPGSVVFFTVPRFHRVARVDQLAGENRRLSIAGWFMTEH